MRKIKLFLEFIATDFVKASEFIPTMTITELAMKFKKEPDYILEFEAYLKMLVENGNGIGKQLKGQTKIKALELYKFHLEENFPTYRGDDEADQGYDTGL